MKRHEITYRSLGNVFANQKRVSRLSLALAPIVAAMVFMLSSHRVEATNKFWIASGPGDFNVSTNWNPAGVPGASDVAFFDGAGLGNCTISANAAVAGINIGGGYTGTITQAAGVTFTIGASGFVQAGGIFNGGSGDIDLNGAFTLSGGTFNTPSGTIFFGANFTHTAGGTFQTNGVGTAIFDRTGLQDVNVNVSETFNNLTVNKTSDLQLAGGDTFIVAGTLSLINGSIGGSTIEAQGNVSIASTVDGGTGTLRITETAQSPTPRTVTMPAGAILPNVVLNAPGAVLDASGSGTVTAGSMTLQAGAIQPGAVNLTISNYNQSGGTLTASAGSLTIGSGSFTQSNGTFNGGSGNLDTGNGGGGFLLSGGTFNAPSGTMFIARNFTHTAGGAFQTNGVGTVVFDGGVKDVNVNVAETFNNLTINHTSTFNLQGGDLIAAGTLSLIDGILLGQTIEAQGNVTIESTYGATNSTGTLRITETPQSPTPRTVTIPAGTPLPNVVLNAPGALLDTSGAGTITAGNLTLQAGAIQQGPVNVTARNYNQFGGTYTAGGGNLVIGAGATNTGFFTQTAGTFNGGTGNLDINSGSPFNGFTLSGGIFNSPSGTMSISGNFTHTAGGAFQHNGVGTVVFDRAGPQDVFVNVTETFNNLTVNTTSTLNMPGDTLIAAGTLSLIDGSVISGAIEAQGNVSVASTFDGGAASFILSGAADQTFTNNGGINLTGTWTISKSPGSKVTLASNLTLGTSQTLNITSGTLDLGASFNLTAGAITIGANGTLRNFGTGNLTLGGNLTNNGVFNFNGGGTACGDPNPGDAVLIRSSVNGAARTWSGAGAFSIVDVDVQDQNATPIAGGITAFTSVNSGNNTNWTFSSGCSVEVTTQPTNQAACPGDSASFTAAASGTGLSFKWRKNGSDLSDGGNISGASTLTLTINPVGPNDAASYDVVVTNSFGVTATSASATLTVFAPPAITGNPGDTTVCEGATAIFIATANGNPSPTVQWQESTNGGANFSNIGGATSATLSFTTNAAQNGNKYRAVFINLCNSATTAAATLTVNTAPAISANPGDTTLCEGATANFTAAANASPAPTVQWQESTDGGTNFSNIGGATSTTLSFTATASQNGNRYRAVFTNLCNSATTAAATLTVNTAPAISANPADTTVCDGATANFSAAASGSPAPTVQWQESTDGGTNFSDIAGATAPTLSFTATASQNGNKYRAVFTNLCNSANTTPATLTVNGFALSSSSHAFPCSGGSGSVNVISDATCAWTAVSNDSFIQITSGSSGTGNGTVSFTVDDNCSQPGRTGTMTIAGLTLTVDQTNPTAVSLVSFKAEAHDNGTFLEWRTGFETDNLGFNIYREDNGHRTLINNRLVAGSALRARSTLRSGDSYVWWDGVIADCRLPIANCSAYWLEDVDLKGLSTWHGPFHPNANVSKQPPARIDQAKALAELGSGQSPSAPVEFRAARALLSSPTTVQLMLTASPDTVKLNVKREGWYRATQPELAAALFNTSIDPRTLQLFVDGRELPMLVQGEQDGRFDLADSIEFYGVGLDSPFTESRTYWLAAGSKPGLRIKQERSGGVPTSWQSFTATIERRDRTVYFSALRNGERENFFGAVIAHNAVDQTFTLSHIASVDSGNAELEVSLQGVTFVPHRVNVELNGAAAGVVNFNGQSQGIARFNLPPSLLKEGTNIVRLTPLGGQTDVSLVDYMRISYQHSFNADNDFLKLTAAGLEQITIGGFTSDQVRVVDVTDANAPEEILGAIEKRKVGYAISFAASEAGERALIAFTTEQRAASLSLNQASNLRALNADLVVITRGEFANALDPLAALRQSQGLSVEVVDIEDIYDEFSFGEKSPYAVREFLAYAKSHWKKKPRFVLFAGDGSLDPKNYLGPGDSDLVPTKLIDTEFMETASDDWLSDFNNDGIADIATGRLPARTADELSAMISKIVRYEQSSPADEALLVADEDDGFSFEEATSDLRALIPGSLRINQVNRGRVGAEIARGSLFEALDRKQFLVNYVGHGSVNQWRGNLLTNADALAMRNDHLPMFVMMTCLNGYFHDAALDSLAESLMKAERGGAVAVWASSGMTMPGDQALLNQEIFRLFFDRGRRIPIGEAVIQAKTAVSDSGVRRTWILLGDPTSVLK